MNVKDDILKTAENLRHIINAPVVNILIIAGIIFITLSFCELSIIKNEVSFYFIFPPKYHFLITGGIIMILGLIVFYSSRGMVFVKANLKKGFKLRFKQITINISMGEIQTILSFDKAVGVVLPANTSFVDDCITDPKSAMGAFILKYFPNKISEIQKTITNELNTSGFQKNKEDDTYMPGTTIILPEPYNSPVNVLITAATVRKKASGIKSNPAIISECIKNIFELTADKKISTIQMPIIGSGHGGVEINFALLSLVLSIWYFSKEFHHIKQFNIIVTQESAGRLKNLNRYICLAKLD